MSKPVVVRITWNTDKPTIMASLAHDVAENITDMPLFFQHLPLNRGILIRLPPALSWHMPGA